MQINSCISCNTALATLLKYTMLAVKCFRMSQGHKKCHMNSFLQSKIKLPNTAHGTMWVKEALENTISNKGKKLFDLHSRTILSGNENMAAFHLAGNVRLAELVVTNGRQ